MEKIALKACNGKYVCAENAGKAAFIANRENVGAWETFKVVPLKGNQFALQTCNGKYVCAERKRTNSLIAIRDNFDAWRALTC